MFRRLIIIAFTVLILGVGVYFAASFVLYNQLAVVLPQCNGLYTGNTPARFDANPFAPELDTSPYWMPDYETVNIASRDPDITLSGWYIPGKSDASVIIVHGLGVGTPDCKRNPRALIVAGMLHRADFNVLLIDLREHGESTIEDGKWAAGTEEYRDVLAAWDWLQTQKSAQPEHIGIMAYSGGTASGLIAAGEESRIAAIWVDSPVPAIDTAIGDRLEKMRFPRFLTDGGILMAQLISGDNLRAFSTVEEIQKLKDRPVYVLHCEADTVMPFSYAITIANQLPDPDNSLWLVPGCDHVRAQFTETAEYERRIVVFFQEHL